MESRTALVAAILCGLAATGLVAADVVWSLEARLQTETAGGWQTIAARPDSAAGYERHVVVPHCAGPGLRLVVANDKPFGDTVDVHISYFNATAKRTETLYTDTWRLDRFEDRTHAFTIPEVAFETSNETEARDPLADTLHVTVRVGEHWLDACVQKEAPQ